MRQYVKIKIDSTIRVSESGDYIVSFRYLWHQWTDAGGMSTEETDQINLDTQQSVSGHQYPRYVWRRIYERLRRMWRAHTLRFVFDDEDQRMSPGDYGVFEALIHPDQLAFISVHRAGRRSGSLMPDAKRERIMVRVKSKDALKKSASQAGEKNSSAWVRKLVEEH